MNPPPGTPRGFALWNLGFRPFYLLAGVFAVLALALWTAAFAVFVWKYWPILTRPRVDGRRG